MKRALSLLVLLPSLAYSAAPTYADTGNGVSVTCASGTCDAPVEASSTTDGLPLSRSFSSAKGITVTACADSGQTLSGAGTLTAYGRDPSVALWAALPDLNLTVTSSARRCQTFSGFVVTLPIGRVTWVPTGVTVSGGGVTVYVSGY